MKIRTELQIMAALPKPLLPVVPSAELNQFLPTLILGSFSPTLILGQVQAPFTPFPENKQEGCLNLYLLSNERGTEKEMQAMKWKEKEERQQNFPHHLNLVGT